jgi:predicted transposase YbfD/YdcC
LWVRKWVAEYVREQLGIPDCRSVIRLDKEIRHPDKDPSFETRFYISSLDPDVVSAKEFQGYILGHWEIENCLHGQKDKESGEDKHVCRSDWGKTWSTLTSMALSLAQLFKRGERTLREVRRRHLIHPLPIAKKLGYKK